MIVVIIYAFAKTTLRKHTHTHVVCVVMFKLQGDMTEIQAFKGCSWSVLSRSAPARCTNVPFTDPSFRAAMKLLLCLKHIVYSEIQNVSAFLLKQQKEKEINMSRRHGCRYGLSRWRKTFLDIKKNQKGQIFVTKSVPYFLDYKTSYPKTGTSKYFSGF